MLTHFCDPKRQREVGPDDRVLRRRLNRRRHRRQPLFRLRRPASPQRDQMTPARRPDFEGVLVVRA